MSANNYTSDLQDVTTVELAV